MSDEGQAVQGNTESAPATGVYQDTSQQAAPVQQPQAPDPGIQAATDAAVQTPIPVEYNFTYPDGVTPDQKGVESLVGWAKEHNITPEVAQKVVDIQANMALESQKAQQASQEQARESWAKAISSDPELGGEKLKETLHVANAGLNQVTTEGFRALLKQTGLGDHPEVVKVFHKIGSLLSDDEFVPGGATKSRGGKMYPNSPGLKP